MADKFQRRTVDAVTFDMAGTLVRFRYQFDRDGHPALPVGWREQIGEWRDAAVYRPLVEFLRMTGVADPDAVREEIAGREAATMELFPGMPRFPVALVSPPRCPRLTAPSKSCNFSWEAAATASAAARRTPPGTSSAAGSADAGGGGASALDQHALPLGDLDDPVRVAFQILREGGPDTRRLASHDA